MHGRLGNRYLLALGLIGGLAASRNASAQVTDAADCPTTLPTCSTSRTNCCSGPNPSGSTGGILIPATAQLGKRLTWAEVVALGPNVRTMEVGDRVLFSPEDRYEVEVRGDDFLILRERDIHAVAAKRLEVGGTGLYL